MQKTEEEIRQGLIASAERRFGKVRAGELGSDIEQLSAELFKIHSFPVELDEEP